MVAARRDLLEVPVDVAQHQVHLPGARLVGILVRREVVGLKGWPSCPTWRYVQRTPRALVNPFITASSFVGREVLRENLGFLSRSGRLQLSWAFEGDGARARNARKTASSLGDSEPAVRHRTSSKFSVAVVTRSGPEGSADAGRIFLSHLHPHERGERRKGDNRFGVTRLGCQSPGYPAAASAPAHPLSGSLPQASRSLVAANQTYAGDEIPSGTEVIEVHVKELSQIFDSMDPSPFHERDLDLDAEEFIVALGPGDCRPTSRWRCCVYLDKPSVTTDMANDLHEAVQTFFARRSSVARQRLRGSFDGAQESRHRIGVAGGLPRGRKFGGAGPGRQSGGRDRSRKPAHRRLGLDVEAPRDFSLGWWPSSRGSEAVRPPERDGRTG